MNRFRSSWIACSIALVLQLGLQSGCATQSLKGFQGSWFLSTNGQRDELQGSEPIFALKPQEARELQTIVSDSQENDLDANVYGFFCRGSKTRRKIENEFSIVLPKNRSSVPLDQAARERTLFLELARIKLQAFIGTPHLGREESLVTTALLLSLAVRLNRSLAKLKTGSFQ